MGVGPGDEVIAPAFTFFATAEVVILLGARPVLVDIEPETYSLDVAQLERAVGPRTKAIIPVHLFGHPADMDLILDLARRHGLKVVEDNAQAIGAGYKGRKTGSLGDAGCLSFFPSKNLGAYGDGGMIVTNDSLLAQQFRMLRTHGWTEKYYPEQVGYNSRLDELQAAILRVKLRHLDQWNESRRQRAATYTEALAGLGIGLPKEMEYAYDVYHLYVIQVSGRDLMAQELAQAGISTSVYYPYPLHLVPAMESLGYHQGDFPVSEAAAARCLAIPLFPEITREQLEHVVGAVRRITEGNHLEYQKSE
jgi:dTDP-4-amino-4,6-dideoxygalactose transaminase